MKRDMELVRKIIFAMEDHPTGFAPELKIDGYTDEQVGYHVYLMMEAGLLRGSNVTHLGSTSPEVIPTALTWAGHEFADAARDDTRWNRAMTVVKEHGGAATLGVLTELLTSLMRKAIGLS